MPDVHQERVEVVRDLLSDWAVDGLLTSSPANRRWLTGFTGSAGTALVTRETAILSTDSRYWEQAAEQAPYFDLYRHRRSPQDTADFLRSAGVRLFGLEANHVTLQVARELETIEGLSFTHLDAPIEPLRQVKSADEIELIRAAASITDEAMAHLPELLRPGMTERQLAWALEKLLRESGATALAFKPIVAFGANSARPHHEPSERPIQEVDIVLVDMGASLNGYCSDLTRTFFVGSQLEEQFEQVYELVVAAQANAIANIQAGVSTQQAHTTAANTIAAGGYGEYFGHGLGHSLGLEIHEKPFLSATLPPQPLATGTVLTIEPGIYLPGWGGVRIEDLIVVNEDGNHALSHFPKKPLLRL